MILPLFARNRFSQDNMAFSTFDRDNDPYNENCARVYSSGFWYNQCWAANPTGRFYSTGSYTTKVRGAARLAFVWPNT